MQYFVIQFEYFLFFWGIYLFLVYYQQYSSLQRIYQSWGIFGSDNFYESVLRSKMFCLDPLIKKMVLLFINVYCKI